VEVVFEVVFEEVTEVVWMGGGLALNVPCLVGSIAVGVRIIKLPLLLTPTMAPPPLAPLPAPALPSLTTLPLLSPPLLCCFCSLFHLPRTEDPDRPNSRPICAHTPAFFFSVSDKRLNSAFLRRISASSARVKAFQPPYACLWGWLLVAEVADELSCCQGCKVK